MFGKNDQTTFIKTVNIRVISHRKDILSIIFCKICLISKVNSIIINFTILKNTNYKSVKGINASVMFFGNATYIAYCFSQNPFRASKPEDYRTSS